MEILVIILACAWALFIMVRHFTKRFEKSSSCCEDCKKCSGLNSCDEMKKK
ncbi:MAG: FeoB-associated Cys-rich membrane protein [Bacillota bacterium]|nr:FeoB-associated Cys-rich membrane protein [Clostridia bacterium]